MTFAAHLAEVALAAAAACSSEFPRFVCSGCGRPVGAKLREKLKRGEISYPRRERAVKKPRAERLAELVEKRAAHAAKMLVVAETKLKRAQRTAKK